MSSTSNVGDARAYEADDQRKHTQGEVEQAKKEQRFKEGESNSHKALDAKDERSIANKLERESKRENEADGEKNLETAQLKEDPTLPAKSKGNEPSKGAKIDKEIQEEEEEMLKKKKGNFGPNASN